VSEDLVARVRVRARDNLFWRYLGVEVEDAREGWARLRVRVRDEIRNAAGAPVHGETRRHKPTWAGGLTCHM